MEECEYAFLRSCGLSVVLYDERGTLGFPRLNASLNIHEPVQFDEAIETRLSLVELDGKRITYQFELFDSQGMLVVEGQFQAACCRFPDAKPPFAILIPEFVETALRAGPADQPCQTTTEQIQSSVDSTSNKKQTNITN